MIEVTDGGPKKSFLRRIIDKRKKEKLTRLKKELDDLKDDGTLHIAAKKRRLELKVRVNEIRNDDNEEDSVASNMENSNEDAQSIVLQPSQEKNMNKTSEAESVDVETNEPLSEPKPTPELDNVIEKQLENLEEETKQDELKANQETVSSISESTNQEKETEPENTEQHGTNDNTEDQNIPHSTIPEDEKTDLDKELE